MARRPTIRDVATEAGVSAATVDRVLNSRSRVRDSTARRVAEAAHRIGYHASGLIDRRLRPDLPKLVFGFVLQKERQEFYGQLAAALESAVRDAPNFRGTALFDYSVTQAPADVAARLDAMIGRADAVAATALDHPLVTAAVERLAAAGIPVFALLSDFAQSARVAYIGLNNLRIGRVAGWMIAATAPRPGKVAIYVGGHRWHGHELRETGFRSYLRESASSRFEVLDTLINLETRQLTHETTLDLLDRHPDTVGIYVAGGGMEGAIAALREVRAPGEVALVVNELTRESRAGLSEGYVTMVDATPLAALASEVLELTHTALGASEVRVGDAGESVEPVRLPSQRFLEPSIYLPESL